LLAGILFNRLNIALISAFVGPSCAITLFGDVDSIEYLIFGHDEVSTLGLGRYSFMHQILHTRRRCLGGHEKSRNFGSNSACELISTSSFQYGNKSKFLVTHFASVSGSVPYVYASKSLVVPR